MSEWTPRGARPNPPADPVEAALRKMAEWRRTVLAGHINEATALLAELDEHDRRHGFDWNDPRRRDDRRVFEDGDRGDRPNAGQHPSRVRDPRTGLFVHGNEMRDAFDEGDDGKGGSAARDEALAFQGWKPSDGTPCPRFEVSDEFGPIDEDECAVCRRRYDEHAKPRGVRCLDFELRFDDGTLADPAALSPDEACTRCGHPLHEHDEPR